VGNGASGRVLGSSGAENIVQSAVTDKGPIRFAAPKKSLRVRDREAMVDSARRACGGRIVLWHIFFSSTRAATMLASLLTVSWPELPWKIAISGIWSKMFVWPSSGILAVFHTQAASASSRAKKLLKRKVFRQSAALPAFPPDERAVLARECLEQGDRVGARQLSALAQAKIAYVTELMDICARFRRKVRERCQQDVAAGRARSFAKGLHIPL
jgi:hypothetical protein